MHLKSLALIKSIAIIVLCFTLSFSWAQQEKSSNTVEIVGDALQIILPTIAGSIELINKDKKGLIQFATSFTVNVTTIHLMKRIINKPRPGNSGNYAFPSGHTAASFHAAAFIHRRHGWKASIPAYLAAAYVGYSRDRGANNRHDMWDVGAGAILGTAVSFIFASKANSEKVRVHSYPLDGGFGLGVNLRF